MTNCTTQLNPDEVEALFGDTAVADAQIRTEKLSSLRSIGNTPLIMTGVILQILRSHFCDTQNIMSKTLRSYLDREGVWADNTSTGLLIEPLTAWKPELMEARPAILIKEQDWRWNSKVIGDISDVNWEQGIVSKIGMWQGGHTIFALTKDAAHVQKLAAEIARIITWFRNRIREDLCLYRFMPTGIGAVSAVKESTEHYIVPVDVMYIAEESWAIQQEAPRLKHIEFTPDEYLAS